MTPEELVGSNVRRIRQDRGLSQSELAEKIGDLMTTTWVSSQVSKLETGDRGVPVSELYAVATALDAPLMDLLVTTKPVTLSTGKRCSRDSWNRQVWGPGEQQMPLMLSMRDTLRSLSGAEDAAAEALAQIQKTRASFKWGEDVLDP